MAEPSEPVPDPIAIEASEPIPDPVAVEIFEPAPVTEPEEIFAPIPDPVAAEVSEPAPDLVVPVPVERASTPPIAQTADVKDAASNELSVASQPDASVVDASVVEEPEQAREATQALEAELARQDLLAADLAMELGRLVEPPEESAYTLYNRVLNRYPDSPEANAGLKAVRQGLINRTLAQLAGNELDNARSSLQAAETAGVNPQLIANLRGEIEYRQQLIDES